MPERATLVLGALRCAHSEACRDAVACRFQVAWAINPHMKRGAGDFGRAAAQHHALRLALEHEGARVIMLPFVHGAFDSVFAKDAALLVERGGDPCALLARPRCDERRPEQRARAAHYDSLGFRVVAPPPAFFEGGDVVVLPPGDRMLVGWGQRTERAAADWVASETGARVVALELRDPYFFHLDLAIAALPDHSLLVCEEALAPESLRALRAAEGVREIVTVPRDEALAFGLNLVPIGDAVFGSTAAPTVERALRARGLRFVKVELDEFHLAGGGAACLGARVHEDPRDARAAARSRAA